MLSVNYENEIPLNENYELITNFLITYLQTKDTSIKYINVSDIYKLSKTIFGIDYYYITNKNIIYRNKNTFEKIYNAYGKRALYYEE